MIHTIALRQTIELILQSRRSKQCKSVQNTSTKQGLAEVHRKLA